MSDHLDALRRRLFTRSAAVTDAHKCLAELEHAVGAGLAASRQYPHLLAALDQHEAALRDTLMLSDRPPSAVFLAAYAAGIRDAAHRHGWYAPAGPIDWPTCTDWVLLRLLAVCRIANTLPR